MTEKTIFKGNEALKRIGEALQKQGLDSENITEEIHNRFVHLALKTDSETFVSTDQFNVLTSKILSENAGDMVEMGCKFGSKNGNITPIRAYIEDSVLAIFCPRKSDEGNCNFTKNRCDQIPMKDF